MFLDRSHLQLLIAIKENQQLGAAARSLNLSPSAASHRIKEAERRLGVNLVETQGRVARLTAAGIHLAIVAKSTEEETERAEETARWLDAGKSTSVRLAVGFYDAMPWLIDVLTQTDLDVRVDVVRVAAGSEERAVRSGEADLAFVPRIDEPSALPSISLGQDKLVAILPSWFSGSNPDAGVEAQDFTSLAYIAAGFQPIAGWELDRFFLPAQVTPLELRQIGSLSLILTMFERDTGERTAGLASIQPSRAIPVSSSGSYVAKPLIMDITVGWVGLTRQRGVSAEKNRSVALAIEAARRAFTKD